MGLPRKHVREHRYKSRRTAIARARVSLFLVRLRPLAPRSHGHATRVSERLGSWGNAPTTAERDEENRRERGSLTRSTLPVHYILPYKIAITPFSRNIRGSLSLAKANEEGAVTISSSIHLADHLVVFITLLLTQRKRERERARERVSGCPPAGRPLLKCTSLAPLVRE